MVVLPPPHLNQDEAVCRGAALLAAMVSPVFRVREYTIQDCVSLPVQFSWPTDTNGNIETVNVFTQGNAIPSTKLLTFDEPNLPISITCKYVSPEMLPSPNHAVIGTGIVSGSVTMGDGWEAKVKVRVNPSGLFNMESANAVVHAAPVANEGAQKEGEPRPEQKVALVIDWQPAGHLPKETLDAFCEAECQMQASDRLVAETADQRNALEEYIYEMRDKLASTLVSFISTQDAQKLNDLLGQTGAWLYEEGVDAAKSVYADRLEKLRALGEPAKQRAYQSEERPRAAERLRTTIKDVSAQLADPNGVLAFASDADKVKLAEEVNKKQTWLESQLQTQSTLPDHLPPVLTDAMIERQKEEIVSLVASITAKAQRAQKEFMAHQQKAARDTTPKSSECSASNSTSACHKEAQGCCGGEQCGADEPPNMQVD